MNSPASCVWDNSAAKSRILLVIPGQGNGSSMIFVRRQAQSLAREGVETRLFYLGSRTSPLMLFSELRRFRSEVLQIRPSVIHAHFGTVTAFFAAVGSGTLPLVITYRGSDLNPPPGSYRMVKKLRAWSGSLLSQLAALRAQRIICVSEQLRHRLWWRRKAVTILPSGVDRDAFRPEARDVVRQRLGWTTTERVVLFHAGHDTELKRLALARASIHWARRLVPSLRLEILDGEVPPDRLPDLMNAADCLLVTSVSEGSPTVVQEALASNLPVVSVEVGDVVERLRDVSDSIIAASDATVLGHALARMVEPPRRSNGRKNAGQFCSRRIAAQLKEIYRELADA